MGIHSKSEEHVHEEVKIKNQNEDKKNEGGNLRN